MARLPQWFQEQALQLQWLSAFEVYQSRGFVRPHIARAGNLIFGGGLRHVKALGSRGGNRFHHQFPRQLFPTRVRQQMFRCQAVLQFRTRIYFTANDSVEAGRACHAEAVEWNVPYQFFPTGLLEVRGDFARHSGRRDRLANPVCARLWRAGVFAHDNRAVGEMANAPRRNAVQTNETEAAQRFFRANDRRDRSFIAKSILQSQHGRFGADQRRQKPRQNVVGRRFEAD